MSIPDNSKSPRRVGSIEAYALSLLQRHEGSTESANLMPRCGQKIYTWGVAEIIWCANAKDAISAIAMLLDIIVELNNAGFEYQPWNYGFRMVTKDEQLAERHSNMPEYYFCSEECGPGYCVADESNSDSRKMEDEQDEQDE